MKKTRQLKNLPVFDANKATLLGFIEEFVGGPGNTMEGFYLRDPVGELCFFPFKEVESIGRDAIVCRRGIDPVSDLSQPSREHPMYQGLVALTRTGQNLGTVEDVVFQEQDGTIIGFEISDGYIKDLLLGRQVIAATEVISIGDQTMIVSENPWEQEGQE